MTRSPFVSFAEAAAMIHRHPTTIKRLIEQGVFHPVPNPVRPMILLSEVEAYMASRTNGHHKPPAKPPTVEKRGRGRPRKHPAKRRACL